MPELPDLTVVAEAFHAALAGRPIVSATAHAPLAVRGTPAELDALVGRSVGDVRQRGKFLLFGLDSRPGRVQPDADRTLPACAARGEAAGEDRLRAGLRSAGGWTPARSGSLDQGAAPGLRPGCRRTTPGSRSATAIRPRWARSTWPPPASSGRSRRLDAELGPDADDPALTLASWQDRIRRHPGELKNLLKNQAFIAGIGNAYSDEILHAARLLPFRKRSSLAPEEVAALHASTGSTLLNAIEVLRQRVPPTFETQVRDFLAVHNKGGQPCPRCGTRISEVSPGGFVTSFCRGCQR